MKLLYFLHHALILIIQDEAGWERGGGGEGILSLLNE